MSSLVPCDVCGRHVRYTEKLCPFCSAAMPLSVQRRSTSLTRTGRRLGRAATFAFGAAALATVGCGGDDDPTPGTDSGTPVTDSGMVADAGGGGDTDGGGGGDTDAGGGDTDAGSGGDTDGGAAQDGGDGRPDSGRPMREDGGGIMPLYGAPPE